jgi:hypothetical protein
MEHLMNRRIAIALCVALLASLAFAQQTSQFGLAYSTVKSEGGLSSLASEGFGFSSSGLTGSGLGLCYSMSMAYMKSLDLNGSTIAISSGKLPLIVDMMVGLGGQVNLGDGLFVLAGIGPSFTYTAFISKDLYGPAFMTTEIGAGAFATLNIAFSSGFGLYAGASASYGLYSLKLTDDSFDFKKGIYVTPSIGFFAKR